jgi:S1-C subfamily serine protease
MKKFGSILLIFVLASNLYSQSVSSKIVIYRYKNIWGSANKIMARINNSELFGIDNGGKLDYDKYVMGSVAIQIIGVNGLTGQVIDNKTLTYNFNGNESVYLKVSCDAYSLSIEQTNNIEKENKLSSEKFTKNSDLVSENIPNFLNHPKTKWNIVALKEHWEKNNADQIEGIYEFLEDNVNNKSSMKNQIGIIKEGGNYKIVNLSSNIPNWSVGELKGELIKTAQFGVFKGIWYMNNKTKEDDILITFDGLLMKSLFNKHNVITKYMKLYPTYSDKANSEKSNFSTGTGFFFLKNGYLITNYHVIDNSKSVKVQYKNNDYSAIVAYKDKANDIAIIKIADERFNNFQNIEYNFKTESVDIGTYVFTLGFPLTSLLGEDIKFTDGKISSKSGMDGKKSNYQITVPIQPGNSGGPLFDENCNLVGITTSTVNRKFDITENVNFAVKTSYVNLLIDEMSESVELPKHKVSQKLTIQEKIKILSKYVAIIKCEL